MQKKTQEKRKNWDWKKRLNVLIAALFLSIVSVMISLCLFAITHLIFKHFSETVETIDSIIPTTILLDSTKLWFFAFISASVIFCVCLRILNDYIEIVKNEQKTIDIFKNLPQNLFINIVSALLKDLCLTAIIRINMSISGRGNSNVNKTSISFLKWIFKISSAITCTSIIQLLNFLQLSNLSKPFVSAQRHSNITLIEKNKKSKIKNYLKKFLINPSNNIHSDENPTEKIHNKRFFTYIGVLALTSVCLGVPAYFAKVIFAHFIGQFSSLSSINVIVDIYGAPLQIIDNTNGMLFICIFECLCLITFTVLLHDLSIYFYSQLIESQLKKDRKSINIDGKEIEQYKIYSKYKESLDAKSKSRKPLDLLAQGAKIFLLSSVATIFFHVMTNAQKSIMLFSNSSFQIIFTLSLITVFTLFVSLLFRVAFNREFFGIEETKITPIEPKKSCCKKKPQDANSINDDQSNKSSSHCPCAEHAEKMLKGSYGDLLRSTISTNLSDTLNIFANEHKNLFTDQISNATIDPIKSQSQQQPQLQGTA